jgi:hypothetical protein
MLDLKKTNLAESAELGHEFELLLPESQDKTGGFITVRGRMSPVVRNHAKRKYTEFMQREAQAKRKGKEVEPMSIDEAEDSAIDNAIVRIIGWRGIGKDGVELPFNKENAEAVLREHTWIRDQVMDESDNLLNFQ